MEGIYIDPEGGVVYARKPFSAGEQVDTTTPSQDETGCEVKVSFFG